MTASLVLLLATFSQVAPDTVVVCPGAFRETLTPWLMHREAQGHRIELIDGELSAEAIRDRIRQLAELGQLRFVVLVGDANPAMQLDPAQRACCVPTHRAKAEVITLWGSPPHIGTDNWYADLDDDLAPELAIGRLAADTPDELTRIVQKIIDYEQSNDFSAWRRRLNFVAGVGGFGRMADLVIDTATKTILARDIPADYRLSMTHGSWHSPYCPDPRSFRQTTLQRLNEGCWFWIYLGHGNHLGLDRVRVPNADYPILDTHDVDQLACTHGAPVALFLACYTGAFDASEDCLAERILREPGGPVAVLAGSRVTMPYGMTVMGTGLLDAVFQKQAPTLGEAVLHAKRGLMQSGTEAGTQRAVFDLLAKVVSPAPTKLDQERAEHVQLFNLLGDPLLRLRYPQPVALELYQTAMSGQKLHIEGTCPINGRAIIELVPRRDRVTGLLPRSTYPKSPDGLAQFQEVYHRANNDCLVQAEVPVANGRLQAELAVPENTQGLYQVRVYVEGLDDFAQGAAEVTLSPIKTANQRPRAIR